MKQEATKPRSAVRAVAAVVFVTAGLAFAAFRVREATTLPDAALKSGENSQTTATAGFPRGGPMGNMTPEQRAAMRKEMSEKLNLTDEQKTKMEELEKKGEMSPFQMMRILTPEQRKQMHKEMQNRARQSIDTMGKDLPPDERVKLEQKFEERSRQIEESLAKGEVPHGLP